MKKLDGNRSNNDFSLKPENPPLVTIITVVFNGMSCIRQTIESVICQKDNNIEYIIVDGGSTDGTLDIIKEYEGVIDCWISEADDGIYDAMNKGIGRSTGKYLLFLNARDELVVDVASLGELFAQEYVIVYGRANMMEADRSIVYVKGKPLKDIAKLVRGTPLCHQAIFYRRDSIGNYDTGYRIIADRVLTYELIKRYGLTRTRFVDTVIANYYEGGFSRQHEEQWKGEEFRFQREAGWHFFAAYRRLSWLFKKHVARSGQRQLRKEGHGG